jgi:hypothetical protein
MYQTNVAALLTDNLAALSRLPDLSALITLPGRFYPPNWASLNDDLDYDTAIEPGPVGAETADAGVRTGPGAEVAERVGSIRWVT